MEELSAWTVTAAPIPDILIGMGAGGVLLGKEIQNSLWQIPDRLINHTNP